MTPDGPQPGVHPFALWGRFGRPTVSSGTGGPPPIAQTQEQA